MFQGQVVSIHIGEPGAPLQFVQQVEAIAGEGLQGDRYGEYKQKFKKKTGIDREITLVETEALEAVAKEFDIHFQPIDTRRNIATRGVPLNDLVGKRFKLGSLIIQGIRLCEPCGHLEKVLCNDKLRVALKHRGGLRAQIVQSGTIHVGDLVEPI